MEKNKELKTTDERIRELEFSKLKEYIREIEYAMENYEQNFLSDRKFFDDIFDAMKLQHRIIFDCIIKSD